MTRGKHMVLLVLSILVLGLSQVKETKGQSIEPELCQPDEYSFANNTVIFNDSSCTQYDSDTQAPNGIDPSEYFRCTFPSVLTDSNLGELELSGDNREEVYTWERGRLGQTLMLFSYNDGPLKSFSRIVVYYYRSNSTEGLSKITFCPISEDSQIWNVTNVATNSAECVAQNNILPGSNLTCNSPPCRENVTIEVNFTTNKVLLAVEASKNFDTIVSEIQFFAATISESTTTIQATDGGTGTSTTPEAQTDREDTETSSLITTAQNTQPMMTTDGTSSGTSSQVVIAAVTSGVVCAVVFYIVGVVSTILIYLAITRCRTCKERNKAPKVKQKIENEPKEVVTGV